MQLKRQDKLSSITVSCQGFHQSLSLKMLSTKPQSGFSLLFSGKPEENLALFGNRLRNLRHSHLYSKSLICLLLKTQPVHSPYPCAQHASAVPNRQQSNKLSVIFTAAILLLLFYHQVSLKNFKSLFNLILSNGPVMSVLLHVKLGRVP